MSTFDKDLEIFEYDPRYVPAEHKWCYLNDKEELKKFWKEKFKKSMKRFQRNRVQSDPETTGQHGTMI